MTRDEMIEKARAAHGDRYDYSNSVFINRKTKVTIRCSEHGDFLQDIYNHINGAGCPVCWRARRGASKRLSKDSILKRVKESHPTLTLLDFEYVNNRSRANVECPVHGVFTQTVISLLQGHGCPSCGKRASAENRKRAPSDVLAELQAKHPDLTFPKFFEEYSTTTSTVTCVCPEHGSFKKRPHKMLSAGQGCPLCSAIKSAESKVLSEAEVLQRFRTVHGDRYDYSRVKYVGVNVPVAIVCKEHGEFKQLVYTHTLQKSGCPACAGSNRPQSQPAKFEEFVERAREVHGDRYLFDRSSYTALSKSVIMTCKEHGLTFSRRCFSVLYGAGCPACNTNTGGFRPDKPGTFYIYRITTLDGGSFAGFGITGDMPRRNFQHQENFLEHGATGVLEKTFTFNSGLLAEKLEDRVMAEVPRASSGVPGFILEAAEARFFESILGIAEDYHRKFKNSEVVVVQPNKNPTP